MRHTNSSSILNRATFVDWWCLDCNPKKTKPATTTAIMQKLSKVMITAIIMAAVYRYCNQLAKSMRVPFIWLVWPCFFDQMMLMVSVLALAAAAVAESTNESLPHKRSTIAVDRSNSWNRSMSKPKMELNAAWHDWCWLGRRYGGRGPG